MIPMAEFSQDSLEQEKVHLEALIDSLNVPGYVDPAIQAARESKEHVPVACWTLRGCSGLMGLEDALENECPHSRSDCYNPCPAECSYTACTRPWHRMTSDINLIFDETVDRRAAIKKTCYTCAYFLTNGPRVDSSDCSGSQEPDAATLDSNSRVTIHLF